MRQLLRRHQQKLICKRKIKSVVVVVVEKFSRQEKHWWFTIGQSLMCVLFVVCCFFGPFNIILDDLSINLKLGYNSERFFCVRSRKTLAHFCNPLSDSRERVEVFFLTFHLVTLKITELWFLFGFCFVSKFLDFS